MLWTGRRGQAARAVLIAAIAMTAAGTDAQSDGYRFVPNWAKLPAGVGWAGTVDAEFDAQGNLWAFHRGAPGMVLQFDRSGRLLKSFAEGPFTMTHGGHVDRDGNVWVTDASGKGGTGYQVFKYSPDGKLLMSLGTKGVSRNGPDAFLGPSDVVTAPNGDIFVADGHGGDDARIVKFSKDGKFIKAWGKKGKGPGELDGPHSITIDSRGRIIVADRGNDRVVIFDQDGRFIDAWTHFGRPNGVFVAKGDILYVADNPDGTTPAPEPGQALPLPPPGTTSGIRIASARDGKQIGLILGKGWEGATADAEGNVYACRPGGGAGGLEKFERVGR